MSRHEQLSLAAPLDRLSLRANWDAQTQQLAEILALDADALKATGAAHRAWFRLSDSLQRHLRASLAEGETAQVVPTLSGMSNGSEAEVAIGFYAPTKPDRIVYAPVASRGTDGLWTPLDNIPSGDAALVVEQVLSLADLHRTGQLPNLDLNKARIIGAPTILPLALAA